MLELNGRDQVGTIYDTSTWRERWVWSIVPEGVEPLVAGSWVQIDGRVVIEEDVEIGDECRLGGGVTIDKGCVLKDKVRLGEGSWISPNVTLGYHTTLYQGVVIGEGSTLGKFVKVGESSALRGKCTLADEKELGGGSYINNTRIQDGVCEILHDLGFADEYRKILCSSKGVAYIGAGCRWFTLEEALRHWGNHEEDRLATMALMESAKALASLHKLKYS